jgi:hypothetical protein
MLVMAACRTTVRMEARRLCARQEGMLTAPVGKLTLPLINVVHCYRAFTQFDAEVSRRSLIRRQLHRHERSGHSIG